MNAETSSASAPAPALHVGHAPARSAAADARHRASFSALHLRLLLVALGLLGLALSVVTKWMRPDHAEVCSLWAMLGLGVAAIPVLIDSLTSLKADGFEATKYYMDQFVALAILACFATAQYATGIIVAAILVIGQMLEEHTTVGVEEAVRSLLRLSRVKARRVRPVAGVPVSWQTTDLFESETVDAEELRVGDHVRVLAGDLIPADGEILAGRTTLDQSSITGESLPVESGAGARVYAGTTNLTGSIIVVVRHTGKETVIGRVTSIVEEAKTSRAPVMRLIDEYTRYYMPVVLVIAGTVLFFTRDVQRAIAVIIVAMPCAFVLASPAVMIAALAVASRMGVLVKSPRFFEAASRVDTVVFDKTGTLTTGRLRVIVVRPVEGVSEEALLAAAVRVEAQSTHPVARAVQEEVARRGIAWGAQPDQVREISGHGVSGGGIVVGRRRWLEEQGIAVRECAEEAASSVLYVARNGEFLGTIEMADTLRPDASAAIAALRRLGVEEFAMLTGDRPAVAERVARETGISRYVAECLPEEKLAQVQALRASGRGVLVVGDGINDAPALAAGDVGVAMGALGSDVAIKTADVALMGSDLRHLASFLALSDRALRLINQNLAWGAVFIALFVIVSALGWVSPVVAALLHEFSAFFVIFNSARLLRFDDTVATDERVA